jgi:flagellar hook-associated protein 2
MDLSVSGLASGFDWKSLVNQMVAVEQAPESNMRVSQNTLNQRNAAYGSIKTELGVLSNDLDTLKSATLFASQLSQSSDTTVANATTSGGAPLGSYLFNIIQLATASVQQGTSNIAAPLSSTNDVSGLVLNTAGFNTSITAGTFTVNGQQITVATTDTLQAVFDKISAATGGAVTGSYDASTDKITLSSTSEIVLGSSVDTSNFLQVAELANNGSGTITSSSTLGAVNTGLSMANAHLAAMVTDGGSGSGEFTINGVSISYSVAADSIQNVVDRINNSAAGVTASYDTINNRFVLTNKTTGDSGVSMQDVTGNFLSAVGLSGGILQHGSNLLYTLNGGAQLTSQSNTISQSTSGLAGLLVTATKTGSASITVSSDNATIKKAITDFVTEYNKVQSMISSQTASSTDSTGKVTAGILASDGDADEIASTLRTIADADVSALSGTVKSLADLGITANGNDNTLSIGDGTALDAALSNHLTDVQTLFSDATNGLAVNLSSFLDKTIGDQGTLVTKQSNLTKQASDIDTQIANMERLIAQDRQRMTDEFVSMETAQAKINQQLSFLQQNFGSTSLIPSTPSSSSTSSSTSSGG